MPAASADDICPKCMLFLVNLQAELVNKLLSVNPEIAQLLVASVDQFLKLWLQNICVTLEEQQSSEIDMFVGVCWLFLEPTSALVEIIQNSIANFVDNFLQSSCAAKGVYLSTVDLEQVSVKCISDLPDGVASLPQPTSMH
ncbi:E4 ORF C [Bat mastadenovirus G]|uniref:E4 ORF C n=1 Tax=Bat mastadenovirus G TaxID=2015376 RepID=A0A1J0FAR6_9ADEN|nr:E4 ORF C [Bat mastadenovirus G]APC26081.1 E4 ORF C [Bat mastadenovirus G]